MTVHRCRFCRRTDGTLVMDPIDETIPRARPGYRGRGAPTYRHLECEQAFAAREAHLRAVHDAEFALELRPLLIDALTSRRNTTIPAGGLVASVYWQNRRTRGGGAWVLTVKDGHHVITRDLPGDTTQTADAIDAALDLLRPAAV